MPDVRLLSRKNVVRKSVTCKRRQLQANINCPPSGSKRASSVRMYAEHKFCMQLFNTSTVYFYSEDLFLWQLRFIIKEFHLPLKILPAAQGHHQHGTGLPSERSIHLGGSQQRAVSFPLVARWAPNTRHDTPALCFHFWWEVWYIFQVNIWSHVFLIEN